MFVRAIFLASAMALVSRVGSATAETVPKLPNYFGELENASMIDVASGSRETLTRDLQRAEALLRAGANEEAAVELYSIVESPRYEGFEDFIEFQNSLYYLGVALSAAGSYETSLHYIAELLKAGPSSLYYAPAHRNAVDIALKIRRPAEVLQLLESVKSADVLPPGVVGERAYLRARAAYQTKNFAEAEAELSKISRKSRLYSSGLYLRGVIRTRNGDFADAANNFCEVSVTPDDDTFTFVVDERYFRIKDLARLGLGRIAHETENYDNAYYHYFQIPQDSSKVGDAIFEAAWSMYQKRELSASRALLEDFLQQFPSSHLTPEAKLLAGYVELADCHFDEAQSHYERVVADLEPLVAHVAQLRLDSDRRAQLLATGFRRRTATTPQDQRAQPLNLDERVLSLLTLDSNFLSIYSASIGLDSAASEAAHTEQQWTQLAGLVATEAVSGNVESQRSLPAPSAAANSLKTDILKLSDGLSQARSSFRQAQRDGSLTPAKEKLEQERLDSLARDLSSLSRRSELAAGPERNMETGVSSQPLRRLTSLFKREIAELRAIQSASTELRARLDSEVAKRTKAALDGLYVDIKRVVDKAKLGKIDAVIGQKRRLEIEVQDLASGRFPAELHGKLWEEGLIGDDEEYWPFEGEYWEDEYEGWR